MTATNERASAVTDVGGQLFARQATGFVREVPPFSQFVFNFIPGIAPLALAIDLFWVLGGFPGANLYLGIIFACVIAVILCVAYGIFSSAIPRSGGDYVLLSRTLHPVVGVISSFCISIASFLSAAFIALSCATAAVGPSLAMVGFLGHSPTLLSWSKTVETNKSVTFLVALIALLITAGFMSLGWHWTMRFQNYTFAAAMLSLLVCGIVLLISGHSGFVANFNRISLPLTHQRDSYQYIISLAHKQGVVTNAPFSWYHTWPAVGACSAFTIYTWWSIHIAGETRRARSWTPTVVMASAAIVNAIIMILFVYLFFDVFGKTFFTSINAISGTPAYPFPAPPYFLFLTVIAGGNVVLAWFLGFGFICAFLVLTYVIMVQPVRTIFAYSFDGLLPASSAYVSPKRHVPAVALAITVVLTVLTLVWAVWVSTFFGVLAAATIIELVAMAIISLGAVSLPYRRPEVWRASATAVRILGVPVIVLAGILSFLGVALVILLYCVYPGLGVANVGAAWRDIGIVVGAAVAFYIGAWTIRRRQGIDLGATYREIPPE